MKSLNMILGGFFYKWAMFFYDKELVILRKRKAFVQAQLDEIERSKKG